MVFVVLLLDVLTLHWNEEHYISTDNVLVSNEVSIYAVFHDLSILYAMIQIIELSCK